jgi:alpha-tubulin suppressor-like RCC1 family protein
VGDAGRDGASDGGAAALSVGDGYACLVRKGTLYCWGDNSNGQLGTGAGIDGEVAAPVFGLPERSVAVGTGWDHTCVVTERRNVECWGNNDYGELGDGTIIASFFPIEVAGLSHVTALALAFDYSCALASDGTVFCWGEDDQGQSGDGTLANHLVTPTRVLDSAVAIAAGYAHTCAVLASGGVKCWGFNSDGELGDGTKLIRAAPVDVVGLGGPAVAIAAGYSHTCAVLATNTVQCWGDNSAGQLGDGTKVSRPSPADVSGLRDVVSLGAGQFHSCAVTRAGAVSCWGANYSGNLGDGTTMERDTPTPVTLLGPAVSIGAGSGHTCALLANDDVECWGQNFDSELGNGTFGPGHDRWTPGLVLGFP